MTYLDKLNANVRADSLKPSMAYEPLPNQICEWWHALPPTLRNREFQLEEISPRLHGRYRHRPAARDVGNALRKLHWSYRRDYRGTATGHRLWRPPEDWL